MRAYLSETLITIALICLLVGVIFIKIEQNKKNSVVEIKEIESIIKAGEFVYNDSKYSIKKIDEKVWAKQALGLYPSQKETV